MQEVENYLTSGFYNWSDLSWDTAHQSGLLTVLTSTSSCQACQVFFFFPVKLLKSDYSAYKKKKKRINSKNKQSCKKSIFKGLSSPVVASVTWQSSFLDTLLLDLSRVQLTNIFMSDSNLPQCSDSSFITVGQEKATSAPRCLWCSGFNPEN